VASGASAIATASSYFEATIEVRIGYGQATLISLFSRQDADTDIQVVRRAQGVL
jgi:hypothetical protein